MKKKILILVVVVALALGAGLNVTRNKTDNMLLSDLILQNIEVLANTELSFSDCLYFGCYFTYGWNCYVYVSTITRTWCMGVCYNSKGSN